MASGKKTSGSQPSSSASRSSNSGGQPSLPADGKKKSAEKKNQQQVPSRSETKGNEVAEGSEEEDEDEADDDVEVCDPFEVEYEGHRIGYECESWAVRKYRTNEMSTVRRGLDDNIQEFLENDLGYIPDHSYEDVRLWIMAFSVFIGIFANSHYVPFAEAHTLTMACLIAYYACVGLVLYVGAYLEGDQLLVAHAKLAAVAHPCDRSQFKGNWVLRLLRMHGMAILGFVYNLYGWMVPAWVGDWILGYNYTRMPLHPKGYKLRVRSDAYMFAPKYAITLELVSPEITFLRKPTVFYSKTEEWSIGEFFDAEGYIYPPAIKHKMYKLLRQGMDKKIKKE